MTNEIAKRQLIEAGCENETKEDRFGDTHSGWWMDDCFLATSAIDAISFLEIA